MQRLHMAMSGMRINGLLCMKAWCPSSLAEYIDMYYARNRHDTCCTDITENEQTNKDTDKQTNDRQTDKIDVLRISPNVTLNK